MKKMMKLFPNLVHAVVNVLQDIFEKNIQADKAVQSLLKSNPKWGSRDRRFLADTAYSVVRWYRLYYEILGQEPTSKEEWWQILGIHWVLQGETLPPFDEFSSLDSETIQTKKSELQGIRKIKESIPDWLDELGVNELDNSWDQCLNNLNNLQEVNLRVNTLKSNVDDCVSALLEEGHQTFSNENDCITLNKRAKLTHLKSFSKGFFEVQDRGSQLIAPFLNPRPNSLVIDACAGAGGKSLHLAALMKNKGKLVSMDIHAFKLKELQKRAIRSGVRIIKTVLIDEYTITKYLKKADYLLLDVPCSGLGTLKRNPGAKWQLTPSFINEIKKTQQSIISTYSCMVKNEGYFVYATCSVLPSENEKQVEQFLKSEQGQEFKLIKEQKILPQENSFDGFYMALLQRA
ncbi:MAG: 16S rRNA (cytosine967-C5)-methyltransferase [Saprospiraceae bacterium]